MALYFLDSSAIVKLNFSLFPQIMAYSLSLIPLDSGVRTQITLLKTPLLKRLVFRRTPLAFDKRHAPLLAA